MEAITVSLRVTAPARDVARVSARRGQFSVGRPLEFDEASTRVAAIEYALGALGGEIVNGFRVFADRRRLEIDAIEAVVSGDIEHGLTYLEVIGEVGPPRISRVRVKLYVAADDGGAARALFEHLLDRLPLVCTLRTAADLSVELILT